MKTVDRRAQEEQRRIEEEWEKQAERRRSVIQGARAAWPYLDVKDHWFLIWDPSWDASEELGTHTHTPKQRSQSIRQPIPRFTAVKKENNTRY